MALEIKCDHCKKYLEEPGGLMFSPPKDNTVSKTHLCVDCWYETEKSLDRLEALQAEMEKFIESGTKFDLNPTLNCGRSVPEIMAFWHEYIRRMDEGVRQQAQAALTRCARG